MYVETTHHETIQEEIKVDENLLNQSVSSLRSMAQSYGCNVPMPKSQLVQFIMTAQQILLNESVIETCDVSDLDVTLFQDEVQQEEQQEEAPTAITRIAELIRQEDFENPVQEVQVNIDEIVQTLVNEAIQGAVSDIPVKKISRGKFLQ
jgi:hypothetical protein